MTAKQKKALTLREVFRINWRGLNLVYSMIPWNLFLTVVLVAIETMYNFWPFVFQARVVDHALAGVARDVLITDVIILVAGQAMIRVAQVVLMNFYFYCGSNVWELANIRLNKKIMSMDYEYMESETIQNKRRDIDAMARENGGGINMLFWVSNAVVNRTMNILVSFVYTVYLISRCTVAYAGEPVKAVLFAAVFTGIFILLLFVTARKNKSAQAKMYQMEDDMLPVYRESDYYMNEYIGKEECGKNIRMFHQQNLLSVRISQLVQEIYIRIEKIGKIDENRNAWASVIEVIISGLIYFILGIMVLRGAITIGSVCLYAGCITMILSQFNGWIKSLTELRGNTKYVKMYFDFMDIENIKYEGTLPVEKRDDDRFMIEFRHVTFRYPGSDQDVLKDFSIKFRIGERLAVVGKNGSGKTTFIKLLCRLYDPTEGEILLNGIDIRKFDYKEYLALFSVVFQDFKIPALSLGENVAAAAEYEEERVVNALKRVGLEGLLQKIPQGLSTPLYTDFDRQGVDVSGGEAQKIAIARALYRDAPFVILDEPTAALDPLAEYEIYSKFDELVGTKTAERCREEVMRH